MRGANESGAHPRMRPVAMDGRGVGGGQTCAPCAAAARRLQAKNKQLNQTRPVWLDRAFSNNERNISIIECETNENENEHLIR